MSLMIVFEAVRKFKRPALDVEDELELDIVRWSAFQEAMT